MPEHNRDPDSILHLLDDWTDIQLEGFFRWGGVRGHGSPPALQGVPGLRCASTQPAVRMKAMPLWHDHGAAVCPSVLLLATNQAWNGIAPPPTCRDLVMAMQADHALGRLLLHGIDHERVPAEQQRILGVHQVGSRGASLLPAM